MNILILYGTTEGQTRKIARFMEEVLVEKGHQVSLADASENPPAPGVFDAIMVGASIHVGGYQSAVAHYIKKNLAALNALPGAFFSVCLAVASDHEEEHREVEKIARNFLAQTGWNPKSVTQIAGALKYTQYDFFKRLVMKSISKKEGRTTDTSQDHEYTDWNQVKAFTLDFIGNLPGNDT